MTKRRPRSCSPVASILQIRRAAYAPEVSPCAKDTVDYASRPRSRHHRLTMQPASCYVFGEAPPTDGSLCLFGDDSWSGSNGQTGSARAPLASGICELTSWSLPSRTGPLGWDGPRGSWPLGALSAPLTAFNSWLTLAAGTRPSMSEAALIFPSRGVVGGLTVTRHQRSLDRMGWSPPRRDEIGSLSRSRHFGGGPFPAGREHHPPDDYCAPLCTPARRGRGSSP